MQYVWLVFAVFTLFLFVGIFAEIATALTNIAKAWNRYFGESTPEPWVAEKEAEPKQ